MKDFDIRIFMTSVRREAGEEDGGKFGFQEALRLLKRGNEDFVREAYWRILGRDVDPDGLAGYAPRAGGIVGKSAILAALLLSPERLLLPPLARSLLKLAAAPLRRHPKKG